MGVPEHLRSSSSSKVDAHTTLRAVLEFQRRVQPQATDAHLGRPRSTMRANRHIYRTPSRAAPRERIRTAQDYGLTPQDQRERAFNVPQADHSMHRTSNSTALQWALQRARGPVATNEAAPRSPNTLDEHIQQKKRASRDVDRPSGPSEDAARRHPATT